MLEPDQRVFEADLLSPEFRIGEMKGWWGNADDATRPSDASWPKVFLWVAAAARPGSPERFYLALDVSGYRNVPPTGAFWDSIKKSALEYSLFPKGATNSRVAKVFRTDLWATTNRALYHPYDRVAAQGHAEWKQNPNMVWDSNHTIVHYLCEIRRQLNCGEYIGV